MSRCARVHAHERAPIEPHTYPRTHSRLGTLPSTPPFPLASDTHARPPACARAHTRTYRDQGCATACHGSGVSSGELQPSPPHIPPHRRPAHRPSPAHAHSTLNTPAPAPQIITPRAPSARPCLAPHPIRARPVRRRPRIVAIPGRAGGGGARPGKARPAAPATATA